MTRNLRELSESLRSRDCPGACAGLAPVAACCSDLPQPASTAAAKPSSSAARREITEPASQKPTWDERLQQTWRQSFLQPCSYFPAASRSASLMSPKRRETT